MKNISLFIDKRDICNRILAKAISNELKDIYPDVKCTNVSGIRDVLGADLVIICGRGSFSKIFKWFITVFKKPFVLYHVPLENSCFKKLHKKALWIVADKPGTDYDYFPTPILLSDTLTTRHVERIWRRERMLSKRGCIGVTGLKLEEALRQKLLDALDLLIEDLDLNILFTPILKGESGKGVISTIKYTSNVKFVNVNKYSISELMGMFSKTDLVLTSSENGGFCSVAVNKPVVGLNPDNGLNEILAGVSDEEVVLDVDKLTTEELYSKIKIAWVHRDSISAKMRDKAGVWKRQAEKGIMRLGKRFVE